MNKIIKIIVFLIFMSSNLYPSTKIIDSNFTELNLCRKASYFIDSKGKLSFKDVLSPEIQSKFISINKDKINFGYNLNSYWIKVTTNNIEDKNIQWLFEYGYPLIDELTFFYKENGKYKKIETGDCRPFKSRRYNYKNFIFPIDQAPGKETFYIKIKSEGSLSVSLTAWDVETFIRHKDVELALLWFFYGIMLALAIYNLFVYFQVKDNSYLFLAIFTVTVSFFSLIQNGLAAQYLWTDFLWWGNKANPFFASLSIIIIVIFSRSFLVTKKYFYIGDIILIFCIIIGLPIMISPFIIPYFIATQMAIIYDFILIIILNIIGIIIFIRGKNPAIFFLFSWGLFLFGVGVFTLRLVGILPDIFIFNWGYQIGSGLFIFTLSFAIGNKYSHIKKEHEVILEALSASEEKYKLLLDNINDGILLITDERIVYANRKMLRMCEYTAEELFANKFLFLFPDTPIGKDFVSNEYKKRISGEVKSSQYNSQIVTKSRIIIDVMISAVAVKIDDKIGSLAVISDISKIKKAEKEFLKVSKMESLEILAGGIAHDFNNLLTVILGNISLIKTDDLERDYFDETIDRIEHASIRAANLTQQLLTFSIGGEPIKKTYSVLGILKESIDFILTGSNVKCSFHVRDDIWFTSIDPGQISQVFNNIIINAMQAMPNGGNIDIVAENYTKAAQDILLNNIDDGKYVKISIKDEGKGIPEKHLNNIFDPYFTTKESGSGLGLASSYSIIKRHGGYINVKSEKNVGAIFDIYLKASEEEPVEIIKKTDKMKKREGKALIMDDEENIRVMSGKILKYFGYSIVEAINGDEAIIEYKKAKESSEPFDLVIMDLTIPGGLGGLETQRLLLKYDPDITSIVSSGYSDDKVMSNYLSYGFKGVLAKPYVLSDVEALLGELFG